MSRSRALGEADQTRTWNLIDVMLIAQSGRYPPNATSFQNGFIVEGEQRYWVHVAIDRFTGQVIDKRIEVGKRIPDALLLVVVSYALSVNQANFDRKHLGIALQVVRAAFDHAGRSEPR